MARPRDDASDKTREGAEARRVKRSLIDPDRALERRRVADAARKADPVKETRPGPETQAGEHSGMRDISRSVEQSAERVSPQEKGQTAEAKAPKTGLGAPPEQRGTVRPGETRDQYSERQRAELREGPERLREQLQCSEERARAARGSETRERRNTGEHQSNVEVPANRQQAERAGREAEGHGDYVWVDRGVVDTKLTRIDRKEYAGVWEEQKTHKHSKEEIDASLKSLPEVRLRLGKETSPEELRALASSSDPKERQIGRSYMSYYESDPIKVDITADGRSTVAGGRHRLARADYLGIDEVPMRVNEQNRKQKEEER